MAKQKKKKKTGLILVIVLLLAAAAAGAVYWFWFRQDAASGTSGGNTVSVRSVEDILNEDGAALVTGRFAGVTEARELVELKLDSEKTLDVTYVSAGDTVSPGDPLFSYDAGKLELAYEQLKLDVEGKKNTIATYEDEIAKLDKQISKAKKTAAKAELTVQRQTAELKLKKEQYELKGLEEDTAEALEIMNDNVVRSEVSGTVRAVNPPSGDSESTSSDSSKAFITIVVGSDLRIAGTVSEQNVMRLAVGTEVTVRSRIDETDVRGGVIEEVNTDEALGSDSSSYSYGTSGEQSSKYRFYVKLDSPDGLIIGQHVYIDLGSPDSPANSVKLPEWYIVGADGTSPYVFAANAKNKIEKRSVKLGSYDAESSCYTILSGLSLTDRVAYPEEGVSAGMTAEDAAYVSADASDEEFNIIVVNSPDDGSDGSGAYYAEDEVPSEE